LTAAVELTQACRDAYSLLTHLLDDHLKTIAEMSKSVGPQAQQAQQGPQAQQAQQDWKHQPAKKRAP